MTLQQLERSRDVIQRLRQSAERAAVEDDRVRWSTAADQLDHALRSRGDPNGARLGALFDESLERILERIHTLVP